MLCVQIATESAPTATKFQAQVRILRQLFDETERDSRHRHMKQAEGYFVLAVLLVLIVPLVLFVACADTVFRTTKKVIEDERPDRTRSLDR